MNITTNKDKTTTIEHFVKQPMQAVELGLKVISARNPHFINSLKRYINHPLVKNYSHIPFIK